MHRLPTFAHAFTCLALLLGFCLPTGAASAVPPLRVVATTTLVADLVRVVGGDRVQVQSLMGPGVDPHLYKASAGDMSALGSARVIFFTGLKLEGRMEDLLRRMGQRGRQVVAVADAIPSDQLLRKEGAEGHPDPHVWGDPRLWSLAITPVRDSLTAADPEGAAAYAARAAAYRTQLDTLHQWAASRIATIPKPQRVLITSHDAFAYFGRAYELDVVAVQGISTVAEAGLADITRVADLVKQRGVKAVFVESSVPPGTIQRISKDAGARVGGELFSDALGTPGEMHEAGGERYDVGTYLGMLKHNVNSVADALR
ncbi:MAG: zinc ABC transporter substrate-binding protein [Verrucomicrobiales bacterium]|nr:zinc ABC transporter substrate-binding protein [Verrucomicrobiales bacterium]